jgi:ComF family protein
LFEPPCAACRQPLRAPLGGAVCAGCWARLALAPRLDERFGPDHMVSWAAAVDHYDGVMKETIHALKYDRRRSISPRLGRLMRASGAALLRDADAVVPVPLHLRREYARGFNQAHDLALQLGPPVVTLLARSRHTPSQVDLPAHQRQRNVENAFCLRPAAIGQMPRIVVLVDDVSTTGATLEACGRVLKAAGVSEVRALTAARVVSARR